MQVVEQVMSFKFKSQQHVTIPMLECKGRVNRCIIDGGPQPIYSVLYVVNGDARCTEFYEDELEAA